MATLDTWNFEVDILICLNWTSKILNFNGNYQLSLKNVTFRPKLA